MEKTARYFLINAICEFGQPDEVRIKAVQKILDKVGFKAKATCYPVFGGIWTKECEGEQGKEASKWLKKLTDNLVRGKFEHETEQISEAIKNQSTSNKTT